MQLACILPIINQKVIRNAEAHVFDWLGRHSYQFYANSFSGALVAQHKRFISALERIMDMIYFDILRIAIVLVVGLIVVTFQLPIVGLLLIIWVLVFISLSLWLNVRKSRFSRRFAASDTHVTAHIADFITNILTVKVFSSTKSEKKEFSTRIEKKRRNFRSMVWV